MGRKELAAAQVEVLKEQVLAIQEFDTADFDDLSKLARAIGADAIDRGSMDDGVPKSLTLEDQK